MGQGAEAVIAAFEQLSAPEREEVVAELLRRAATSEHGSLSDDELVSAADQVFLGLDRSESEGA